MLKDVIKRGARKLLKLPISPAEAFFSHHYQRINQRRLEHLSSLGLDIEGCSVLEVGAGVGDHTSFFTDRGCTVVSTDARPENLKILRSRFPHICVRHLDLDNPDPTFEDPFDIVYCYGTLYHLQRPSQAIEYMSKRNKRILLLETCVSIGDGEFLNFCKERAENPTQSVSGEGCRPTRRWVYNELKRHFDFAYLPITQPNHEEFPIDWDIPQAKSLLTRAIFLASRNELNNRLLLREIPMRQTRH